MIPLFPVPAARACATRRRPRTVATATALAVVLGLAGCSTPASSVTGTDTIAFFDDSLIHEIHVQFNDEDYQQMLATFTESGDKDWISATVTVDGSTLENVGLRLKGNSSLMSLKGGGRGGVGQSGVGAADEDPAGSGDGDGTAESPEALPWLIRTDKFVDGQEYQGRTDLVIRGNNSESSLNEALALELIGAADLATLEASATRFSVNDSGQELRLVIESPDDEGWNEDTFAADGSTYKADSSGDYSYRGENAADYQDAFKQKTGDEEDLQPVVDFLDFVNNSSDADFAAQLGEHLDVDAFARYLAMQDLLGNMDDIDGPGNNSYLRYDEESGKMTVVTWDMNLAFGSMPGMGGGMERPEGMPEGMEPPEGMERPEGTERPEGMPEGMEPPAGMDWPQGTEPPANRAQDGEGAGGRGEMAGLAGGADNPLTTRFHNDAGFQAKYEQALAELRMELFDSGQAQETLDKWSALLTEQAADLVAPETVQKEAESISAFFTENDSASGTSPQG